jgi:hypothetical protein
MEISSYIGVVNLLYNSLGVGEADLRRFITNMSMEAICA